MLEIRCQDGCSDSGADGTRCRPASWLCCPPQALPLPKGVTPGFLCSLLMLKRWLACRCWPVSGHIAFNTAGGAKKQAVGVVICRCLGGVLFEMKMPEQFGCQHSHGAPPLWNSCSHASVPREPCTYTGRWKPSLGKQVEGLVVQTPATSCSMSCCR